MKDKFTSRKFILAVLGAVGAASVSLSTFDGKTGAIAAIISIVVPAITYIITEGVIDAKAVGMLFHAAADVTEVIDSMDDEEKDEEVKG